MWQRYVHSRARKKHLAKQVVHSRFTECSEFIYNTKTRNTQQTQSICTSNHIVSVPFPNSRFISNFLNRSNGFGTQASKRDDETEKLEKWFLLQMWRYLYLTAGMIACVQVELDYTWWIHLRCLPTYFRSNKFLHSISSSLDVIPLIPGQCGFLVTSTQGNHESVRYFATAIFR